MARRKKLKLPLISSFKIKKNTLWTSIGVLLFLVGSILLLSYINSGSILIRINKYLVDFFGWYSVMIPILVIIVSSHFFNSKKLTLIKPNVSLGLLLISISIIGLTSSGQVGNIINSNLVRDFSNIGTSLILLSTAIIGIIIFLNTSLDSFILFFVKFLGLIINFFKSHVFKSTYDRYIDSKKKEGIIKKEDKKPVFVSESNSNINLPIVRNTGAIDSVQKLKPISTTDTSSDMFFKPLSAPSLSKDWIYPPLSLLTDMDQTSADRGDIQSNSRKIEETLDSFGIRAKVVETNPGPTVTQYAINITMGTKLAKITALSNDLALALAATTGQVRIEAPIPGRSLVGIEIPNIRSEIVTLKRLLIEEDANLKNINEPLRVPLGLDVSGKPVFSSIHTMPHVLIAGTTGSGKSVMLHSWICTLLIRSRPDEVNLILVDPKRVELSHYDGLPHLVTNVIVEPMKIISALKWTVKEMENRYKLFSKFKARDIVSYNQIQGVEKKPYLVFIIDELSDLMMFARSEVENLITRIAQLARATGIHLVLATQRPSVDVITGLMKANIPTRVAFNVASMIDSRVVLDSPGAEKLLGKGDMLFLPPDQAKPKRIQGPYLPNEDISSIVNFLKMQTPSVQYSTEVTDQDVIIKTSSGKTITTDEDGIEKDPLFNDALQIVTEMGKGSSSVLQRRLSIGYARAARILDQLEQAGYLGPAKGSKPRDLIRQVQQEESMVEEVVL